MGRDEDDLGKAGPEGDRTAIVSLVDPKGRSGTAERDRHLLVRLQGPQVGRVVSLHGAERTVGRARNADLWLGEGGVSRSHARFVWESGSYVLEDLESANGSYANGNRITRIRIKDGDVLQFGPSAVFRYSVTDADEEAMLRQLYEASVTDSLTGAYNREHFDTRLESELSFSRQHETPLSLLMLDIDFFKKVNDTYGHQAGDAVLVEMSAAISSSLRAEDVFARYGGEEFAVILRGVDIENAQRVGERLRSLVESLRIEFGDRVVPICVSVGAASLACCGDEVTAGNLIATADRRLYTAKREGRNRVVWQG